MEEYALVDVIVSCNCFVDLLWVEILEFTVIMDY